MKFLELKDELRDFTIFSLNEIRNIEPGFHRRRLNEWQDKGYIKKVIRGYYIFSDLKLSEEILFKIANRIYLPSYVSLESALSYYHLIPESVSAIFPHSSSRKTSLYLSVNYQNPALFLYPDAGKNSPTGLSLCWPFLNIFPEALLNHNQKKA